MIADTTFILDLLEERRREVVGPARSFFARHRARCWFSTIITLGEIAAGISDGPLAGVFLSRWPILALHPRAALEAAAIDRHLQLSGARLGENDNWIAGIARYNRQPVVSRDQAFDRVPGLRRLAY